MPFVKKRQRHGRNRGVAGAIDRAFYKKSSKARSKPRSSGRNRPCLLQKIVKGTVETVGRGAQPTVPFAKKRQRHGRNRRAAIETATSRHGHPPHAVITHRHYPAARTLQRVNPSRRRLPSPLSRRPDVSACKTPYSFSWPIRLYLVHNAVTLYTQSEQGAFTASPDEEEEHAVNDR